MGHPRESLAARQRRAVIVVRACGIEYRRAVLIAIGVLLLQSLMIAWLLHERRARQRAEIESRRNLSLAADINRRETMSALTTSIGHELGQPLSSMMHNAQALQAMVTADRASPDATGEILAISRPKPSRHSDHRTPSDNASQP